MSSGQLENALKMLFGDETVTPPSCGYTSRTRVDEMMKKMLYIAMFSFYKEVYLLTLPCLI